MNFHAVLFDCDGVLVDSEPITNGVLRDMLTSMGWQLSADDCMAMFVGKAIKDEVALIARHTGVQVDDAWIAAFRAKRDAALLSSLQAVPHIEQALAAAHGFANGKLACASGADRGKVELQLGKTGLLHWFNGHIYSGHETPRSKPAPDVYLAAAAGLGVDPKRCVVVEDTATGVTAGVAAGCRVLAYVPTHAPASTAQSVKDCGATENFSSMQDLHALLRSIA